MIGKTLGMLLLAGGGLFVASKAFASAGTTRREVVGNSGNTWFVESSGGGVFSVFMTEKGADMVLRYRQDNSGKRTLIFKAPSVFGNAAESDFI